MVLFAVVFIPLELVSANQRSATWDEPLHLAAGYAALTQADYRLDASHPPLMRMWAALPLALGSTPPIDLSEIDRVSGDAWTTSSGPTDIARRFLYQQVDADATLMRGRLMVVVVALATGWLLCWWAFEWFGFGVAVCTLALYAVSPTLLAHGALVTTDMGATFGFVATLYFAWKLSHRASRPVLAGLALSISAAVLSKYSALMLLPLLVVLLGTLVWHGRLTARYAATAFAIAMCTAWLAVWAVYDFRFAPGPSDGWQFALDSGQPAVTHPLAAHLAGWIDRLHLLPSAFTQGLLFCIASSAQPAYLLGEVSTNGWWYYFPVALILKTPTLTLVLIAATIVAGLRQWRSVSVLNVAFLAVPISGFMLVAMVSGVNIGIRHVLPIQPLLLLVAATTAARWATTPQRAPRLALLVLASLSLSSFVDTYPHTLTFFNRLAGGPGNGLKYLADSNLDWGQGLKNLKQWMDRSGVAHINLAYFGQSDPEYYGINCTYLPARSAFVDRVQTRPLLPGFVAISATTLSGTYLPREWRSFYEGFRQRQPLTTIGHSIRVYWVESWPESQTPYESARTPEALTTERALADGLSLWLRWPEHAAMHYRRYLANKPNDPVVTTNLGLALASAGNTVEARQQFERALILLPSYERARNALSTLTSGAALQ